MDKSCLCRAIPAIQHNENNEDEKERAATRRRDDDHLCLGERGPDAHARAVGVARFASEKCTQRADEVGMECLGKVKGQ